MKNKFSLFSLLISIIILTVVFFSFYPKWKKEKAEATISWDVSGYYLYLPATFIYKDVKELKFFPSILEKYEPTPGLQQAFINRNGSYVMKYSCGQAIMYSPFFFIAHAYATISDYEPDGFSTPYQFMISFGSLLVAFLGLIFLRKILLEYFSDTVAAISILLLVFGTNYLDYTAINSALTHNYLFTLYSILIWQTIALYKKPTLKKGMIIGLIVGLSALTRPVEIISLLIPVLWGIKNPIFDSVRGRLVFFKENYKIIFTSAVVCLFVGSIQLFYWKYAGQEWIIYSYQDQGFSWLHPHLYDGLLSYKSGWLVYTPIMVFSLIGFIPLFFRKTNIFYATFLFSALFIYITFSWDIWWYGGSLGQRAMIQAYPILAFPLAAFISIIGKRKFIALPISIIFVSFVYSNLWLTYQAHDGGMFKSEQMTKAYFWKTLGRWEMPKHALKLLDTDEEFIGERKNIRLLYENNFESDSIVGNCEIEPISGSKSLCLNGDYKESQVYFLEKPSKRSRWIRATADFRIGFREWDFWKMTQFTIRFYNEDNIIVKEKFIRLYRTMYDGQTQQQFIDIKTPDRLHNRIGIQFINTWGDKPIVVDNLKVEAFD